MARGNITIGRLPGLRLSPEQWEALADDIRLRIRKRDEERAAGKESLFGGRWRRSDLSIKSIARKHGCSRGYVADLEAKLRKNPAFHRQEQAAVLRDERGWIIRAVPLVLPANPAAGRPKELVVGSDRALGKNDLLGVFARSGFRNRRWG